MSRKKYLRDSSKEGPQTGETIPTEEQDDRTRRRLMAMRTGRSVGKAGIMARGTFLTAAGLLLLMAIAFAASMFLNFEGSFTIKALRPVLENKAISLSETPGFANPSVKLSAAPITQMNNITYDWLPLDELDKGAGSYNGEDYIAYTFYVDNSGSETLSYSAVLQSTKTTLAVDQAVRIMVYRNGEPTIYAQPRADGKTETVPEGVVNFESDTVVFSEIREDLQPGEKDRWTFVVWLEGEDPECVNNILGGTMKMELDMDILEGTETPSDEETSTENGGTETTE